MAFPPHFIYELNKLGQSELIEVLKIITHRLQIMNSEEYYLHIPVNDLPLPPSVISVLLENNIYTVRELRLYDLEKLMYLRHIGQKRMLQINNLINKLEECKEKIKALNRDELASALM